MSAPLQDLVESTERQHVLDVLASVGGDRRRCAEILGISLRKLYYRLSRWGLSEQINTIKRARQADEQGAEESQRTHAEALAVLRVGRRQAIREYAQQHAARLDSLALREREHLRRAADTARRAEELLGEAAAAAAEAAP